MAEYFGLPSEEKSEEDTGPPDFSISFWSLKKRMDIKPQKELFGRMAYPCLSEDRNTLFRSNLSAKPLTLATFMFDAYRHIGSAMLWTTSDGIDTDIRSAACSPSQELYEVTYINSNKKNHGQIKDFKVAAFIPELKSLLTRYQLLLPFHLLTPLPLRSEVTKYTINMELDLGVGPTTMMNIFSFILARNATTRGQEWGRLHKLLSQGQGVDDAYFYTNFEVKVLDSNVWSHLVEIAWWMEEGVAEAMKSHKWGALMVRIDNWTVVGSLKEATETMKKVSVW
ncbi:hypothetical protein BZA77DRAFT_363083 [Pyronema omphalodes]|nr:hypothetical protein BZA77DRAFT_363083 [Pyronema omphalodes]